MLSFCKGHRISWIFFKCLMPDCITIAVDSSCCSSFCRMALPRAHQQLTQQTRSFQPQTTPQKMYLSWRKVRENICYRPVCSPCFSFKEAIVTLWLVLSLTSVTVWGCVPTHDLTDCSPLSITVKYLFPNEYYRHRTSCKKNMCKINLCLMWI